MQSFLLAVAIKQHLRKYKEIYLDAVKFLNENIYVDDLIGSHPSIENVPATSLESINIFQDASMELYKWNTNSKQLHQHWVKNGVISNNAKPFEENNFPNKVLGLEWTNVDDKLYFDARDIINFVAKMSIRNVLFYKLWVEFFI